MFNEIDLSDKSVFVRVDLNVPIEKSVIIDDYRLEAILPTVDELLSRGATVILGTHLGRPQCIDSTLSTNQLIPWFKKRGYSISFLKEISNDTLHSTKQAKLILLENLRFFKGEQSKEHKERAELAKALSLIAEFYVHDAFGIIHRSDTSIIELPLLFEPSKRSIGRAITKELNTLSSLTTFPKHPFLFIMGGNKLSSKIPLVKAFIDKGLDTIAWCPAPVFTLLFAQGKSTGKSFIDQKAIKKTQELLKENQSKHVNFMVPIDYQVAHNTIDGPLSYIYAEAFPSWAVGISIGPKTIEQYINLINTSKFIFYNGLMGMLNRPETLKGVIAILKAMANSAGTTIVAGGDSAAVVRRYGLSGIDHISIGGGATIAYLSGEHLPSLEICANQKLK